MTDFFISDLHLNPLRSDTLALVCTFLDKLHDLTGEPFFHPEENRKEPRLRLFLLGDIFDVWLGDDDPAPAWDGFKYRLKHLVKGGFGVYWIAGNRDFLVGERFFQELGIQALKSPTCITLSPTLRGVILHGDELCTKDKTYQWFRRFVRHPWIKAAFLSLPIRFRTWISDKIRERSRRRPMKIEAGNPSITSVDPAMMKRLLKKNQAQILIHGHTHIPGFYPIELGNGQTATRIVLGEWQPDKPSILRFQEGKPELLDALALI